ncbi:MAG TPA: carboxypeptidase-like regulatory domain-containing protein [Chloroflexia bacterium]|nr:carboxypeptidase-like regulatory domain-containing protein [Chloroflexia bacterium]
MNVITNIGKAIRTLGVMGIMLALAGFAVSSAPSASAASLAPRVEAGTLAVHVDFAPSVSDANEALVTVLNQDGKIVAQAVVNERTIFATKLPAAAYIVTVEAKAFKPYSTKVMITSGQTSTVSTTLEADGVPANQ